MAIVIAPLKAQEKPSFFTLPNMAVYSTDALVRALDAQSTLKNLNHPCKCFGEAGVGFREAVPEYGYSLAIPALAFGIGYWAHKHNHRLIERGTKMFAISDAVYDGTAVVNNWKLEPVYVGTPFRQSGLGLVVAK